MALNTNKREGDKLHAEEWNELVQEVQGKQSRLNIVDALDSDSNVDVLSAKQGNILNNKIEDTKTIVQGIETVIETLPVGYFYGTFTIEEELPSEISEKGYAYVGTAPNYVIYTYEPTIGWSITNNKYGTSPLETDLETKSQTKAPTTKAVQEGIEAIDVTLARSAEEENELTTIQKFNASSNINDRGADVVQGTGEVNSLGYKILNPNKSFASQVTAPNTIYEIRDKFDLNNQPVSLNIDNITLKFNGGKLINGTLSGNNSVHIEAGPVKIFDNISFTGGIIYNKFKVEWFVDIYEKEWTNSTRNSTKDASSQLQEAFNCGILNIFFTERRWYPIRQTINIVGGINIDTDLPQSYVGTSGSNDGKYIVEPCIFSNNIVSLVNYTYSCKGKTNCIIRGLNLYVLTNFSITSPEDWETVKNTPAFFFKSNTNVWGLDIDCQIQAKPQYRGNNKDFTGTELSAYASAYCGYTGIELRSNTGYLTYVTIKGFIHGFAQGIVTGRWYAGNTNPKWFTDVTIYADTVCVRGGILGAAPTTIYGSHQSYRQLNPNSHAYQYYWYSKGDIINRGFVWDLGDSTSDYTYFNVEPAEGDVAPTYQKNTYYKQVDEDTYTILSSNSAPSDWDTNFSDYYYRTGQKVYSVNNAAKSDNVSYNKGGANYNQGNKVTRCQYTSNDLDKDFIQLLPNKLNRVIQYIGSSSSSYGAKADYGIKGLGDFSDPKYMHFRAEVTITYTYPSTSNLYVLGEDGVSYVAAPTTVTEIKELQDAIKVNDYYKLLHRENLFGTNFRDINTVTGNSGREPISKIEFKSGLTAQHRTVYEKIDDNYVEVEQQQESSSAAVTKVSLILEFSTSDTTALSNYLYIGGFRGVATEVNVIVKRRTSSSEEFEDQCLSTNAFYGKNACYAKFPLSGEYQITIECKKKSDITYQPLPTIYIPDSANRYITSLPTELFEENEETRLITPWKNKHDGSQLIYNRTLKKMVTWNSEKESYIDTLGYRMNANSGDSTSRPINLTATDVCFPYFDTTLGKPIFWNGTAWVDASGSYLPDIQISTKDVLLAKTANSSKTVNVYTSDTPTFTVRNSDDNDASSWLSASLNRTTLTITALTDNNEKEAPNWIANTFYTENNGEYILLSTKPNDWDENYANYYTKENDVYISVVGNPVARGGKVILTNTTDEVIINVVQNYI